LRERGDRVVHLFHIVDPRDIIDGPEQPALLAGADTLAQAPQHLRARAELLLSLLGHGSDLSGVHTHARIGPAVETLLQACIDYEADLLMVGSHGRRGMERLLLGSVSETLVRKANCPVIVVRRKDYSSCSKTTLPDAPYAPGESNGRSRSRPPHEGIGSTESSGWHPSDSGPTGMRIV
jgi:nucleotide-binding universal stress UspA family protein